jgi:hypothetical protein
MPSNLNDGSKLPPQLKVYLHAGTLVDLPGDSVWPCLEGVEALAFLKAAGFDGVQGGNPAQCRQTGLLTNPFSMAATAQLAGARRPSGTNVNNSESVRNI